MRCGIPATLFALVLAQPVYALPSLFIMPPVTGTPPQVRTLRAPAAALFALARERSATVRHLLDEIAATDVIVYLQMARDPRVPRARTTLLGTSASRRFLLVTLNPAFNQRVLISLVAHELQHVLEIGRARDVSDEDALRRLYQRIGIDADAHDHFETTAADLTERHVFQEVAVSFKKRADAVMASAGKDGTGSDERRDR